MGIADAIAKHGASTVLGEIPLPANPLVTPGPSVASELACIGKQAGADAKDAAQSAAAAILARMPVYQTQFCDYFIFVEVGGKLTVLLLDSTGARDNITARLTEALGKIPPKQGVDDAITMLRIRAQSGGGFKHVANRVAKTGDGYALDLGDGNIVLIRNGSWAVERNTEIAFIRGRGYGTLPHPVRTESPRAALELLLSWLVRDLGIPKKIALLVVVALVEWLRCDTAFPVINLYGPAGCGKSTAGRSITQLVDPTESGGLVNIRMDEESIAAAAQHRHVLTFDNVSKLSASEQDLLCICATGGELVVRKLYTNSDTAILPLHRPVLVTSIQPVATRADLLSRTVPVEFAPRKVRASDAAIQSKFLETRPALLGALCELLSVVI